MRLVCAVKLPERGGVASPPRSLLFLRYLFESKEKGAEDGVVAISSPYVMNFQIPLSHKIESIKSPVHCLPPTFVTLSLPILEFYHFAQSESRSAVSWDS